MNATPSIVSKAVLTLFWESCGFPIDSVHIARRLGVKALKAKLPTEIASTLTKVSGADPIILVDEFDSDNRKRFLFAKMLGYHCLRIEQESYEPVICYRDSVFLSLDDAGRFATEFAVNLLMPPDAISELPLGTTEVEVIAHFGVPGEIIKLINWSNLCRK